MARPELIFEFLARYQLDVTDRVAADDRSRVFVFPDAVAPLPPERDIPEGVLVRVAPAEGEPWLGVFPPGQHRRGPHRPSVIGWPDEMSFCVVNKGSGSIVRSDDPLSNHSVPARLWITGIAIAPAYQLVLFTDLSELFAYGPDGLVYESDRLATDDLTILRVEGREVILHGFFHGSTHEIAVDLETWKVRDLRRR